MNIQAESLLKRKLLFNGMSKRQTPADCQEVQVKVTFTELFFTRLLPCNWISFNFTCTDLLFFTRHSGKFMVVTAKHNKKWT